MKPWHILALVVLTGVATFLGNVASERFLRASGEK